MCSCMQSSDLCNVWQLVLHSDIGLHLGGVIIDTAIAGWYETNAAERTGIPNHSDCVAVFFSFKLDPTNKYIDRN